MVLGRNWFPDNNGQTPLAWSCHLAGIHSGHRLVVSRNTGPATWLPSSFFGNQTESKITKIVFLSKMVTLQFGLLSISLLIANSLGAPQQRQDVSRSQDPLNCNDLDIYGFHCVPIFQCSNEGIIKTDARGLFDPRYLENLLLMFGEKLNYNSAGQRGTTAGTTTTRTGSAAHRRDRRR